MQASELDRPKGFDAVPPSLEVASTGSLVIERVLSLTMSELDFRVLMLRRRLDRLGNALPDVQQDYMALFEKTEADARQYKDAMAETEPIKVAAELVVVRGVKSKDFRIRERQAKRRSVYSYTRPSLGNLSDDDVRPGRTDYVVVPTGYSDEFALARFTESDLVKSMLSSKGFFWEEERVGLVGAVLRNSIPIEGSTDKFLRPRVRPFRVNPPYIAGNGKRYLKRGNTSDLIWAANYWPED